MDDFDEFLKEVGDVQPLKQQNKADIKKETEVTPGLLARKQAAVSDLPTDTNFLTTEQDYIEFVLPQDPLEYKKDGVQEGVYKKLRQGKYTMDARLDLHHHTVEQARKAVFQFIQDCLKYDIRTGIIVHGKGEREEPRALLKSYTNKWLKEIPEVLAFHSALKQNGGVGAVYVLLKKSESEKQKNRLNNRPR
ncbi:DNA endonuclease SmrA [Litoribrevibacter albus]|uniref:Smr domain protein n=1 Tax=Litoribrevibacter albus TaxID=1473156 RepID=A0AA37SEI5_9GAMM|nr:DNA endonuclease SmrA [Litoribrevibacter albus]GLQ33108.1 Smr domain protein [Litoribrevibacter albus]